MASTSHDMPPAWIETPGANSKGATLTICCSFAPRACTHKRTTATCSHRLLPDRRSCRPVVCCSREMARCFLSCDNRHAISAYLSACTSSADATTLRKFLRHVTCSCLRLCGKGTHCL